MERNEIGHKSIRKGEIGCILFATSFLLLYMSRKMPSMAQWYSIHIYATIVEVGARISGIFPFSLAEIILYLLIVFICWRGIRLFYRLGKRKADMQEVGAVMVNLFLLISVLFFLYTTNCGINYHRTSFAESTNMKTDVYSVEELKKVCVLLTEEINQMAPQVKRDTDGIMYLDGNEQKEAAYAMEQLAEEYPELEGYYPKPKALLNPWILSVQNLTGVYSPFTVEANYNGAITDYNIPFTACHELSHLRGFMQEQEANFIAHLACVQSDSIEFQYSGYVMGWIYCMNALQSASEADWEEVRVTLSEEVEPDLLANNQFWAKYDGTVAEVANTVNDNYLKANGQNQGVQSYGKMVDLMVAYYQSDF